MSCSWPRPASATSWLRKDWSGSGSAAVASTTSLSGGPTGRWWPSFAATAARSAVRCCSPTPDQVKGPGHDRPAVSYTHLRAHETGRNLVCRLLLEKKKTTESTREKH